MRKLLKPHIILILLAVLLQASCRQSSNNNGIPSVTENLSASNEMLALANQQLFTSIKERANDPSYSNRATEWIEKATKADTYTAGMLQTLEKIGKQQGITRESGHLLYIQLVQYRQNMLGIDTNASAECRKKAIFISKELDSIPFTENDFRSHFFRESTVEKDNLLLVKFKNNILVTEYAFLSNFNNRTAVDRLIIEKFSLPLIAQSTQRLSPGEKLEISAGIGEMSQPTDAIVEINGKQISFNDELIARESITASPVPGKHSVLVRISFLNQATGKREVVEKNIEYIVVPPCKN